MEAVILVDIWTWPGWTPLGVLFAAVAAVGAILAWTQSKRSQDIADDRYLRDITPRPRVIFIRDRNLPGEFEADILNAGGAAVATLFLVHIRKAIVAGGIALPSHGTARMQLMHCVSIQQDRYPATPVLVAAMDVQGDWWDCGRGVRIQNLQTWWADELPRLSVPALPLEEAPDGLSFTIGMPEPTAESS